MNPNFPDRLLVLIIQPRPIHRDDGPIVAVASQPRICSESGNVNSAMIARRMESSIIVTITGTATTPFSIALQ